MTSPSERKHHLAGEIGHLERHLGQPPAVGGTAEPAVVPAAAIRMPGRISCIEDVDTDQICPCCRHIALHADRVVAAEVVSAGVAAELRSRGVRPTGPALVAGPPPEGPKSL